MLAWIHLSTLGRLSARLALGLCLFAPSAHAASVTTPDFNHDGIADRVLLPTAAENSIVVRVSGSKPQVLTLDDTVYSLVTADVDHDGDLDVAPLEEHGGFVLWINEDGKGNFAAATRTPASPRVVLSGGPLATASDSDDSRFIAHFSRGGST